MTTPAYRNTDRSDDASIALEAHAFATDNRGEDIQTQIEDLLCNLMHLSDQNDVSFDESLSNARRLFSEECLHAEEG